MTCDQLDHTAVSAPSKGGKSFFGREVCRAFMRAGKKVLVCDPLGYSWPASWVTRDVHRFIARAKQETDCLLLVDEAGLSVDRQKSVRWLLTTSRHNKHVTYALMQDYTQLQPEMRKQFTQLCLFACHPDEADAWARQFHRSADVITKLGPNLDRYAFLKVRNFSAPLLYLPTAPGKWQATDARAALAGHTQPIEPRPPLRLKARAA